MPVKRPPDWDDAAGRGLLAKEKEDIHTFSNGTEWECWASGNCFQCLWYDIEKPFGEGCAFESAAFLGQVSPALAILFGWKQNPKYADYQGTSDAVKGRHGWQKPDTCAFFTPRKDNNGEDRAIPPEPDPLQLVLIADPTEVIAGIQPAPRETVNVE